MIKSGISDRISHSVFFMWWPAHSFIECLWFRASHSFLSNMHKSPLAPCNFSRFLWQENISFNFSKSTKVRQKMHESIGSEILLDFIVRVSYFAWSSFDQNRPILRFAKYEPDSKVPRIQNIGREKIKNVESGHLCRKIAEIQSHCFIETFKYAQKFLKIKVCKTFPDGISIPQRQQQSHLCFMWIEANHSMNPLTSRKIMVRDQNSFHQRNCIFC